MATGLAAFAAAHPELQEIPPAPAMPSLSAADIMQEQADRQAQIDDLKQAILQQLEQGEPAHIALYAAIKCIGIATGDTEWTAQTRAILDSIHEDLEQQSLLSDNAAIATARLQDQRAAYIDAARKQLDKQLRAAQRITRSINEAVRALDDLAEMEPATAD